MVFAALRIRLFVPSRQMTMFLGLRRERRALGESFAASDIIGLPGQRDTASALTGGAACAGIPQIRARCRLRCGPRSGTWFRRVDAGPRLTTVMKRLVTVATATLIIS